MPRFAANLSMLYNELDFLDRFAAAASDGFTAVEYLFPYAWAPEQLSALLRQHGLRQVLFNAPPGDWDAGERGLACIPGREGEFLAGLERAIAYARALDCPRIHVMAGLMPAGVDAATLRATYVANLRGAAEQAQTTVENAQHEAARILSEANQAAVEHAAQLRQEVDALDLRKQAIVAQLAQLSSFAIDTVDQTTSQAEPVAEPEEAPAAVETAEAEVIVESEPETETTATEGLAEPSEAEGEQPSEAVPDGPSENETVKITTARTGKSRTRSGKSS